MEHHGPERNVSCLGQAAASGLCFSVLQARDRYNP
jgi:hypothetical protein